MYIFADSMQGAVPLEERPVRGRLWLPPVVPVQTEQCAPHGTYSEQTQQPSAVPGQYC